MDEQFPTISVSIVTFNNANVLENRLDILLPIFKENNITNLYMVDSSSTDGTIEILKKIANDESLLKIILLEDNKGFGYGHNQAIKLTDSQYHIIMNLDTTPKQKDLIFNMGKYMNSHHDIDLLSPLVHFPDGNIQYLTRNEPTVFDLCIRFLGSNVFKKRQDNFVNLNGGYDHTQIIKNATGSFMFLRTIALKKIGGFDERYFLYMEDTDLTKSINQNGKALFSPYFEVIHEWQRGNHSIGGAKLMIISMIKYFNKWGWRLW